jgi:hypothetical protein
VAAGEAALVRAEHALVHADPGVERERRVAVEAQRQPRLDADERGTRHILGAEPAFQAKGGLAGVRGVGESSEDDESGEELTNGGHAACRSNSRASRFPSNLHHTHAPPPPDAPSATGPPRPTLE